MVKKSMYTFLIYFFFGVLLSMCCSTGNLAGGSSSGTTNGVVITASNGQISGTTIENISVSIYNSTYFPVKDSGYTAKTISDNSGNFSFSDLKNSYYNILVQDSTNNLGLFLPNIPLLDNTTYSDTIDILEKPGGIKGRITPAKVTQNQYNNIKIFSINNPVYLYITGSPFVTIADDSLGFMFDEMLPGKYTIAIHFIPASNDTGSIVTNDLAVVVSDSIVEW